MFLRFLFATILIELFLSTNCTRVQSGHELSNSGFRKLKDFGSASIPTKFLKQDYSLAYSSQFSYHYSTIPNSQQTASPSKPPSLPPTKTPSQWPSSAPIVFPTASPTNAPVQSTDYPTVVPSATPVDLYLGYDPTFAPTQIPSFTPSSTPISPTDSPSPVTSSFTGSPSFAPTSSTSSPSFSPIIEPTKSPIIAPFSAPLYTPSEVPTFAHTYHPSVGPAVASSASPNELPVPTVKPSRAPAPQFFNVAQKMKVASLEEAQTTAAMTVLQTTIAESSGIDTDQVINLVVSAAPVVTTRRGSVALQDVTILVTYTILVKVSASSNSSQVAALYAAVKTTLENSISSGAFTSIMQSVAADNGVTVLQTATATELPTVSALASYAPTVSPTIEPTLEPTNSVKAQTASGSQQSSVSWIGILGIILGGIIVLIIIGCVVANQHPTEKGLTEQDLAHFYPVDKRAHADASSNNLEDSVGFTSPRSDRPLSVAERVTSMRWSTIFGISSTAKTREVGNSVVFERSSLAGELALRQSDTSRPASAAYLINPHGNAPPKRWSTLFGGGGSKKSSTSNAAMQALNDENLVSVPEQTI